MEDIQSHTDKIIEFCLNGEGTSAESARAVTDGLMNILYKILPGFDEQDDFQYSQNPLLIDLVVKNVMKYLKVRDLSSCRQVCKLWNIEAGAFYRKQQKIVFYPESISKMKEFTRLMGGEKGNVIPFTSFAFTVQFESTQFSKEMMGNFVMVYGHRVKNLEIFYPNDGNLSTEEFKSFFLRGMTNVESLHLVNLPLSLTRSSFLSQEDKLVLPFVKRLKIDKSLLGNSWSAEFLRDLFTLMPHLEEYEVWTWNSTEDKNSKPYFQCLSTEQKKCLRVLRPGWMGDHLGQCLPQLDLRLTKLFLPVVSRQMSSNTVETLLLSQRDTLEEFQLNSSSIQDSFFIQFPFLGKLKFLHIMVTYPWKNELVEFTPKLDYHHFPSLHTFKLELAIYIDSGFISYFFPEESHNICPSLQEIDLSFNGFREEKFITSLSLIFPNVRTLRLNGYGNRIFSGICWHLPQLEELELYLIYGFNIDDQMTGISKQLCSTWRQNGQYVKRSQQTVNLANLNKLQHLIIKQKECQGEFFEDCQCITDLTVYFAMSDMKHLKSLRFQNIQFSDECRQFLHRSLQDCWLDFL